MFQLKQVIKSQKYITCLVLISYKQQIKILINPALEAGEESKKNVLSLFEGNKNKDKCSEIF